MSAARMSAPGATRSCPHCRTTVLERALRCPQCLKHLRVESGTVGPVPATPSPFRVEGTIRAPDGESWEYNVLVVVRDANGQELTRQLVAVGAIAPAEARTFTLSVDVTPVRGRQ